MRRRSSRDNPRVLHSTATAPLLLAAAFCLGATGCSQSSPPITPDMGTDPFVGVAMCKGTPLTTDGTLDVNVKTLHVSGKITLNGAVIPDGTDDRGSLLFKESFTGTTAQLPLGMQGAGHYDALLAPAQYDVSYVPNPALCQNADNKLPCIGGVLKSAIKLTASGALDLDIPAVTVTGKITLNSAAVPADAKDDAAVVFTRDDSGVTGGALSTAALGTNLHNFSIVLLKGSYDIGYVPPALGCSATSEVPCNAGPLKKAVAFNDSGAYDVDVPAVKVGGRVTVNGVAPAGGDITLGALTFQLHDGGDLSTASVQPPTGLEPYQLTLLGGTYDIRFASRDTTCQSTVPCIDGRLKKDVNLTSSGVLDVDILSVQLAGKVTIAGQQVDTSSQSASLVFINADKGQVQTGASGIHMLSQYRLSLIPGVYQIMFSPPNGNNCSRSPALAPCIAGILKKQVIVQQTGTLDVDVPVVNITGHLSLNGADVPTDARSQGQIAFSFADASGGTLTTQDLGPYSLRLLPGTYRVNYLSGNGARGCDMTAEVPCNSGPIKDSLSLSTNGSLDLDIGMVHVSGRVTLDGMPMPTTTEDRGQLLFILGTSAAYTPAFGTSGAVTYDVALLKGAYKIAHYPLATDCAAGRQIPCVGQVPLGCN